MADGWHGTMGAAKWLCTHLRLWLGVVLWLAAMFCLATAAEGINKNEWIGFGSIPITLLTFGFVMPRKTTKVRRWNSNPATR